MNYMGFDCNDNDPFSGYDYVLWALDADRDGYIANIVQGCGEPSGDYVDLNDIVNFESDCNDHNSLANPGATEICDGADNDCDGAVDEDCPTCDFTLAATDSTAAPKKTGSTDTTATVEVTLNEPAPTDGCTIDLSYAYTLGSGGHGHYTVPQTETLIGKLSRNSVSFSKGESGKQSVTYTSGEIGGKFTITATESKTKASATVTLEVKVGVLGEMQANSYYRFTGETSHHSDNHHVEAWTYDAIRNMAYSFYDANKATLGINDASLKWGGMFDICGTWKTTDTCDIAKKGGHSSHKKGTSVDIDSCALSTISDNENDQGSCASGYIAVDKIKFEKLCNYYYGKIVPESTIHCEF